MTLCLYKEEEVYRFLSGKQESIAPTFAQQLLEAVSFAHHVVGLDGAEDITHSPRIRGLAAKLLSRKRPIRQMAPLTKTMIMALERAVVDSECLPDAIIAGQALFCVYARARWGDAQHISDIEVDGPETGDYFMQAKVWKTKTSAQTNHKNDFLPMVAMGNGLQMDWGRTWLEKRKKAGLIFAKEIPALPVLLTTGSFGEVPMRTGEGYSMA